jgi:hypothetical protein
VKRDPRELYLGCDSFRNRDTQIGLEPIGTVFFSQRLMILSLVIVGDFVGALAISIAHSMQIHR